MLREIPDDIPRIDLRYRTDGGPFNIARLRSRTRTTYERVTVFQYADDNCTLIYELKDFQNSEDKFSRVYMRYKLTMNVAKTRVLLQRRPRYQPAQGVKITISGLDLENVE